MKEGSEILPDSGPDKEEKEEDSQIRNSKFRNISQLGIAQKETETIVLNPEASDLDSYCLLLRRNLRCLPADKETGESIKQKLFERLSARYEHEDSPSYLYAISEALQANTNMLLDSESGRLFDIRNVENVLDVQEIVNQQKLVYVSFNGLIYKEYIRTLAQMLVGDVDYFTSKMYRENVKHRVSVIFDEPASYLDETFIDMVNKSRNVDVYGILTPQMTVDTTKLGGKLMEQLAGNVNTLFIRKTDEKGEAEYWNETTGTYQNIDVASVTKQEDGYSGIRRSDWLGDRGTKRNVDRFKISPNKTKELHTGEFTIYRTTENINLSSQKTYVQNALNQPKNNSKIQKK